MYISRADAPHVTRVLGRYVASTVGGQLRGDKECPFSGITNSGSLEEDAGKRRSECGYAVRSVCSASQSGELTSERLCR